MDEVVTSERQAGQRFLVNSLMEEAIRSSQLEGATTSRRGRQGDAEKRPRARGSQRADDRQQLPGAAVHARRDGRGPQPRSSILELHRIVTEGTLDDPAAAGRLQQPGEERVAVFDRDDGRPIHRPPPAEQLPERMQLLCDFANQGDDEEPFIHPVMRAILLHFWLAYDHPFEDGNGRTAQDPLLLADAGPGLLAGGVPADLEVDPQRPGPVRQGLHGNRDRRRRYDLFPYPSAERDRARSIEDLHVYLQRKAAEVRNVEKLLQGTDCLNGRQLALLTDAVRAPRGLLLVREPRDQPSRHT